MHFVKHSNQKYELLYIYDIVLIMEKRLLATIFSTLLMKTKIPLNSHNRLETQCLAKMKGEIYIYKKNTVANGVQEYTIQMQLHK